MKKNGLFVLLIVCLILIPCIYFSIKNLSNVTNKNNVGGVSLKDYFPIKENVKWLFMSEDIHSSMKSIFKGELSIFKWIKSYQGDKEYSILALDDIIPFFYSLIPFYHQ